ncbi:hypothetical protein OWR29_27915 [Actinoplanes sp. Pm04-4]|uniref:Bacterial CdiA-CT RNAse A domain-containing protein n=1 Tax=Paractinoplanes pyxinae TaxID=2997416 RepID=A0ABT4B5T7_9ACTN|nr:hypothetical protein [Actinoplanes pyxinae]MCY1141841.1 hypothetical protein [Actinoplanes pyxinae]
MPTRPRSHGGSGGDTPDPPSSGGPRPHGAGGPRPAGNIAAAQQSTHQVAHQGRAGAGHNTAAANGQSGGPASSTPSTDDLELSAMMKRYDQLGDTPPTFNLARNDDAFDTNGAHTVERHGPDVPLRRDPTTRTVEGRVYGDPPWPRPENQAFKWTDHTTMNREVNRYVRENWETIRSDLAEGGRHEGGFDAHHRVGEGYYNKGMFGAGPRQAEYRATSLITVRINVVPGSDPPQPFIVTAFPSGLL